MKNKKGFASDNYAGVHPRIMEAIVQSNVGEAPAYGNDIYTQKVREIFKTHFGKNIDLFFVCLGTAANVLGLKAAVKCHQGVVCTDIAHINTDECGAPERWGLKLLPVPHKNGKIRIEEIEPLLSMKGRIHSIQPKVISITQATELGTVYSVKEIREIADFAHAHDMYLHMDGARIANAAVSLGVALKEITHDAGVDILSFGGTKNGMMYGEAVLFFDRTLAQDFNYIVKQGMQLVSKMRFVSVQFEALLKDDLWKKNAQHANKMAKLLADNLKDILEINIINKVEANTVFAVLPKKIIPILQKEFSFYLWDPWTLTVRWMTSFDTNESDVVKFTQLIENSINNSL